MTSPEYDDDYVRPERARRGWSWKRPGWVLLGFVVLWLVLLVALNWQWTQVHLSQETGTSNSASRAYDWWSGFGSVIPWNLGVLVGLVLFFFHHNCHKKGCWRLGKPVEGTPYLNCHKHHPAHEGTKRNVDQSVIDAAHAAAQARSAA